SRVPPPGTNPYGQPNPYYQPPAQQPGAYTPPTYGAPAAPVISPPPGFSQTRPAGTNPVSFAPAGAGATDGLNWQSVTRQPAITKTKPTSAGINPQTTLTTIRSNPAAGSSNPFVNAQGQPTELAQLPRTAGVPTNTVSGAAPAGTAPIALPPPPATYGGAPAYTPVNFGTTSNAHDPWRGR
ncbi:MAG TPA: hypothetical protein VL096_17910, partial [Pirellulaceae bacterium]|nr:hypothetical protein [Pirellulaceae bacterium]